MNARWLLVSTAFVATAATLGGGCQRVLGIHGSQVARSDGGAGGNGSTGGGTGGHTTDASSGDAHDGDTGASDGSAGGGMPGSGGGSAGGAAGSSPGTGAGGGAAPGGAGGDPGDAGSVDAGMPDPDAAGTSGAGGGDAGMMHMDAMPADATPNDMGGIRDGASSDTGSGDAGACASPWQAAGVEARLLTPDTSASAMTACSIAGSDVPALAAAVDATNYRAGQACGACLRVQAATGTASVIVPVVEKSGASGVLLTKAAMDQIAPGASLTMVNWTLVACDVQQQPVHYYIKDGSNARYVGIQIRNARYPIATVVAVGSKTSVPLALQPYDFWESTSAGAGPLTLRLTDINGQSFDDPGIKVASQTDMAGSGQFPLCR